jgi:hypothetical protein
VKLPLDSDPTVSRDGISPEPDVIDDLARRARCATYDTDYADALYFSDPSSDGRGRRHLREAIRCCLLCPVRAECLNQALSYGLDVGGIWAAATPTERRMTAGLPLDARLSWLKDRTGK